VAKRKRVEKHLRQAREGTIKWFLRVGPIGFGGVVFATITALYDPGDFALRAVVVGLAVLLIVGWGYAIAGWIRTAQVRDGAGDGVPLAEVLDKCSTTLVNELDRPGRTGWTHDLKTPATSPVPVTALATSYGLKLNRLLGSPVSISAEERIATSILTELRSGTDSLWSAHTQGFESVDVSATILSAIVPILGQAKTARAVDLVSGRLDLLDDEYGHKSIYALTSLISGLLRVDPDRAVLSELVDSLVEAGTEKDGECFWPVSSWGVGQGQASFVHTARAVTALNRANRVLRLKGRLVRMVDGGTQYLSRFEPDPNADKQEELIQRTYKGRPDLLHVRHFTPALVLRALAEARAEVHRYDDLGRGIMRYYRDGAFWWSENKAPIWMMYQSCQALQSSALVRSRF